MHAAWMVHATVKVVTKATPIMSVDKALQVRCPLPTPSRISNTLSFAISFRLIDFLTLNSKDRCYNVRCGRNARCIGGACYCENGYHGDPYYDCQPGGEGLFLYTGLLVL